jgi:hypothetical protein
LTDLQAKFVIKPGPFSVLSQFHHLYIPTKQNKTKQNKTKQNKTKQNKTNTQFPTPRKMHDHTCTGPIILVFQNAAALGVVMMQSTRMRLSLQQIKY